jgi:hypothetical protein
MLSPSDSTSGVPAVATLPPQSVIAYGPKVMLALPWQKVAHPITSYCMARLMDNRRTASLLNFGDAFIAHTRNTCVDVFLDTKSDWILFIDDDMLLPFGNSEWYRAFSGFDFPEKFMALNTIDRLMASGKSLVGALYFGRWPGAKAVYNEGTCNPKELEYARNAPYDLVKPTRWVGTGCMLVHRQVFLDIEKKFPRLARGGFNKKGNWFTSTEATLLDDVTRIRDGLLQGPMTGEKAYKALALIEDALAKANFENPLGTGEDVSFCLRAAAAGHQPHIDMGLVVGHIGHKVYGPKE